MPLHPHPVTTGECAICMESFEDVKRQEETAELQPQKCGLYGLYKCDREVCTIVYCMPCLVRVANESVALSEPIECSVCFHAFDATALRNWSVTRNKAEAIPAYDIARVKATRDAIECVAAWHTRPGRPLTWFAHFQAYEAFVVANHPYGYGKEEFDMFKELAWNEWWDFWRAFFGCPKNLDPGRAQHRISPLCMCGCWDRVRRARSLEVRLRPSDIKMWNKLGYGKERLLVNPSTLEVRLPGGMLQLVPDEPEPAPKQANVQDSSLPGEKSRVSRTARLAIPDRLGSIDSPSKEAEDTPATYRTTD